MANNVDRSELEAEPQHDAPTALAFLRRFSPSGPWVVFAVDSDDGTQSRATFLPSEAPDFVEWLARHRRSNIFVELYPARRRFHE